MKIYLTEVSTGQLIKALILPALRSDMPSKKHGWKFNWRNLSKTNGAFFYKLVSERAPTEIEGILMLTLLFEEMVYMNNIEVSPQNYGSNGNLDGVAGALIAYACKKSFELGKDAYTGFLSFDSKTALIPLYEKKYGATWAIGQKMFISPVSGKTLMNKYLNLTL